MLGIGIVYFVMGMICLQGVDEKLREDYKNKKIAAREYRKSARKSGRKPLMANSSSSTDAGEA